MRAFALEVDEIGFVWDCRVWLRLGADLCAALADIADEAVERKSSAIPREHARGKFRLACRFATADASSIVVGDVLTHRHSPLGTDPILPVPSEQPPCQVPDAHLVRAIRSNKFDLSGN